ncbi:dynamin-2 [Rhizoctonia solani AG-1 IA]|uniref:Dynamin-2 n=1 Tax=Thanatephorus cucumeris (strain AG1-IA) TaxID=983506 RepID=L8X4T8_THACA|nr:dynamin-2 [Rhizoctonia solani AG-1 IA]
MDGDLIQLVNKLQDTFANLGTSLSFMYAIFLYSREDRRGAGYAPDCCREYDSEMIVDNTEGIIGGQPICWEILRSRNVRRDFLPRGQGIVTRRPLVLQLIHTPEPATEYAQFLHTDKRFTDFADIRREIEAETFRVAGQNKGVSKLPISLRIYSPHVLNLTLVDLPGLTKIPVGDQPSDIERQIRNLILDFITKPNCVILAVSPANVDLANSDSLKLARSVDPQGKRTIGVLTKLDLMDAGTHALDILTGRVYPLKLGFIGVVNRSQQDINTERSMEDARANEARFFKEHLVYRNIAHKQGTAFLAKTLNHVLINHIREKLPDMKARLNTLMGQTQQELNAFGDATLFGDKHQVRLLLPYPPFPILTPDTLQKGALILRLMTSFARDFVSSIEGTNLEISTKELSGGARIYYIFNDVFGHALNSLDATGNLTTQDIRTAIRNSHGPRPSMFVPELAFDLLVKPQIKLLEMPSLRCVELVYEELVKICHNCTSKELVRFPKLHAELIETVSELLRERLGPTSDYTQSLIDIQAAYINTNHPNFMRGEGIANPINTSDVTSDDVDEQGDLITPSGPTPPPNPIRPGRPSDAAKHSDPETTSNIGRRQREKPRRASSVAGSDIASGPKDTFLGYFFGGQPPQPGTMTPSGPGGSKIVGATTAALLGPRHERAIGRDTMSESGAPPSSFEMRRSLESQNAAFDMKSLGRHIEAVPAEGDFSSSQRDEWETSLIRSLIQSYFGIVRQTIQDIVPKAIMHLLVNHTCQQVQNRLVSTLYNPEKFDSLLHEDENLVSERARVKALLDAYKDAFKTLSEVSLNAS